jgi:hypothetical protein
VAVSLVARREREMSAAWWALMGLWEEAWWGWVVEDIVVV